MANGGQANENDSIQIAYIVSTSCYGLILSIDGNGSVTNHFPLHSVYAGKLQTGRKIFLKTGFTLDNAPYYERFFLITSKNEFKISTIINNAKQIQKGSLTNIKGLPLHKQFKQYTIIVLKGAK